MENEIRTYNGKKQVKKGKTWRPCCSVEECATRVRVEKEICNIHKIVKELFEKSKESNSGIEEINNIKVNNIEDYKLKQLSKREGRCKFKCNCGKKYEKNIRQILNVSGFFCKECTNKNKLQKIKDTCLEIYGVENPSQSIEVKKKMKKTNKIKYGVENPSQSPVIKQKKINTSLKNYDVKNPSQSPVIKQKKIVTCLRNHDVEYPLQSPEIIQKSKDTCLEKYGVEYPLQSLEVRDKIEKSRYKRKEYKFNDNNIVYIQGYEKLALKELEKNNGYTYEDFNNWGDNKRIQYKLDDIIHYYFPDIPFLRDNLIIEVKSTWTMYNEKIRKNIKKALCVLNKNINFQFWIYDKNKNLIILDGKFIKIKNEINREIHNQSNQ